MAKTAAMATAAAKATTKADAGPSTAQLAKCASFFAQDDKSFGEWEETSQGFLRRNKPVFPEESWVKKA